MASSFSSADFMRRFRLLILLAWLVPPLFGSGFLLLIDMFSLPQMLRLLATPLELGFILGWLLLSQWCFGRLVRPLADWLAQPSESAAALALARMRAFPRFFWGMFLFYLLLAPASVIFSAEMATGFEASSGDWLRVHLVALIVSIIVGLPVFFAIFDLFGRAFGGLRPPRPVFSIRTKVFMVGALMPLLAGALLVLYYWTRTGYFSLETLFVWIGLQLLAMLGALMFARSLGQSLQPLEAVVEDAPALLERRPSIRPSSSDELGVLTGRYQDLLERLYFHGKALQVGGLVLAARDVESASGKAFEQVVALCREALRADIAFLLLFDEKTRELVGVVRTDVPYRPEGYDRFPVDATSLSAYVFRQGELVVIDDARGRDDPRVNREMAEKFGLHAAIAVPLRVEDRVIGVLMGADQRPGRHYSAEDRALIEVLAREAASVVHTLQLQARRREAEAQLQKADEFARATLQSIADGVVATDTAGRVDYLNAVAEKLTGWAREEALGQPLATVLRLIDEDGDELVADPVARCLASAEGFSLPGPLRLLNREGDKEFAVEVRGSAIHAAGQQALGVVLVFHDTTELTSLTHRLSYQASHDSLTGLLNRHEFEARLELALESARHENIEHVLCYMDLDRFKVVNDSCGHVAGDELLKQLATRMRASVREADILARLGGDEFGLLLEGCHLEQARGVVDNLLQMVSEFRFVWADKTFDVGISIGLAPISAQSGNITDVLSAADSACYMAKDQGRSRLHIFEQDDLELLHQKGEMQWLQVIRQALEDDDFVLYQQAIRPMKGIPPVGDDTPHSEVLLRLRTGEGELAAPNSFLPAAERYHLMPQIDRWVVSRALAFLRDLRARGEAMKLSINLSGQSLCDEEFPVFVTEAVLASGVPPSWLCFEVTETTAITNLSRAVGLISALKRMGCRFALDDFGSGLSSFNYLRNLPVDYLKIDGSFVKDMDRNAVDRAMVEAINEIGHLMDIQTVAEFVTRLTVLEALDEMGVDHAQGYFIARPEPLLPE